MVPCAGSGTYDILLKYNINNSYLKNMYSRTWAKQKRLEDKEVIKHFVKFLKENGIPDLEIDSYPDKENRNSPEICVL